MERSIAVVLLSGGQDSTTCLHWALRQFDEVIPVSVDYGQRHKVELERAREIAEDAGISNNHVVLNVDVLKHLADSALVDPTKKIEGDGGFEDSQAPNGLPTSFVPGRNILFLTLVSAVAVKMGARHVVTGVCQTDYSGYPDCRNEFIVAMNKAVNLGMPSGSSVEFHTPLMFLTKKETVELARDLGEACMAALGKSVTCYEGKVPGCGKCPACELRAKGFQEAGVPDPQYG